MNYDDVKAHLNRRPFVPITIHTADGDLIPVKSPEFAFLHPRRTYLFVARDGSDVPIDRFIALDHISQLSTENGFDIATEPR